MSQPKIYVGNLSYNTTNEDLSELFGQFGDIVEVKLITDRETGRSKGFAFITFTNIDAANNALELNNQDFQGRQIRVNLAKEREDRRGGNQGARANY